MYVLYTRALKNLLDHLPALPHQVVDGCKVSALDASTLVRRPESMAQVSDKVRLGGLRAKRKRDVGAQMKSASRLARGLTIPAQPDLVLIQCSPL